MSGEAKLLSYDADLRRQRVNVSREKRLMNIFMIVAAGFALISDGYQNNVMSMLNKVFPIEYGSKVYSGTIATRVSNASLVGTILGQVIVGVACDYMGRKWSILVATVMLVGGSALCAASHGTTVQGMFWMLTVMRGVTGFGIGAEYPCCSVSANEAANEHSEKRRGGIMVLVTNLPLSLGGPFANIIFLIVYSICGKNHLDALWRTMFALGCLWPLSVFYFRWKTSTNTLYKKGQFKSKIPYWLIAKYSWSRLLGTCFVWFCYDFVAFSNGLFSATIISSVIKDGSNIKTIAEWNLLLGIIAVPGCFVGAYLCDRIGRKYTLMFGFGGYLVFGLIIGCAWDKIHKITGLFIVFYGLMNALANAGPGDMLGLTSSESFPTAIRGTCYGLSAAIGKVGAVVGVYCFNPVKDHLGIRWVFIIAAICGLAGILATWLLIPHSREDDLMEQDIKFHNFLINHGWTGTMGMDVDDSDLERKSTKVSIAESIGKEPALDVVTREVTA
ncbi:LANO_0B04698g1_1 [Lachancea nothofagi CBS 11611]|uniref:LANO_0B04698g1_1 n=1 Tax=Lachancea nothofagi CBS 11611 TaxID=1266666 RepID=A0A1G4IXU1_9SACH|nr:LANO_0B04698g1_1 [Lachancea nothofagi CBS 11611]